MRVFFWYIAGWSDVLFYLLGYDSSERPMALSYNYMSERIRKVGLIGDLTQNGEFIRWPDTIEVPPQLLDFVWQEGDGVTRSYQTGPTADLKISAKF